MRTSTCVFSTSLLRNATSPSDVVTHCPLSEQIHFTCALDTNYRNMHRPTYVFSTRLFRHATSPSDVVKHYPLFCQLFSDRGALIDGF